MTLHLPRLNVPGYQLLADAFRALESRIDGLDSRRAISEGPARQPLIIRQKTVVVVVRPTAEDTRLVVREVRYGTLPPGPPPAASQQEAIAAAIDTQMAETMQDALGAERRDPVGAGSREPPVRLVGDPSPRPEDSDDDDIEELPGPVDLDPENPLYEWAGSPFGAFPDYGQNALAYEFAFWDPDAQGVPTADTAFLRCRREHDAWITELPGGGTVGWAVLRGYPDPEGHVLYVQLLQKPAPFVGKWAVSPGAPLVEVFTYGGLKAIEYVQHLVAVDEVRHFTPVLVIVNDGQHRFALHLFKFLVGSYQPAIDDFRVTDCVP
jgi:hypothetical protein